MKKNRMMRLASILLVCVLMTTSVISGTFAKYTTQDAANDTARVAKWGVELQVVGNLYGDSYGANNKIVKDDDTGITVQAVDYATNATDVVAPGTQNDEGFTFSLKGQPEVDGKVTTEMKIQNVFLNANTYGVMVPVDTIVTEANFDEFYEDANFEGLFKLDGNKYVKVTAYEDVDYYTLEDVVKLKSAYYPVVYKLDGNTETTDTTEKTTVNSLEEAAKKIATQLGLTVNTTDYTTENGKAITVYTGEKAFQTNDDLADWKVDGLTLTWAWAFGDVTKVGNDAENTDKADTILGLLNNDATDNTPDGQVVMGDGNGAYVVPVEYTDYCVDTMFSIDITATQVD